MKENNSLGLDALIPPQKIQAKSSNQDIKKILEIMDALLSKLPEEEVKKFSESSDFELYKRLLEDFGVSK